MLLRKFRLRQRIVLPAWSLFSPCHKWTSSAKGYLRLCINMLLRLHEVWRNGRWRLKWKTCNLKIGQQRIFSVFGKDSCLSHTFIGRTRDIRKRNPLLLKSNRLSEIQSFRVLFFFQNSSIFQLRAPSFAPPACFTHTHTHTHTHKHHVWGP